MGFSTVVLLWRFISLPKEVALLCRLDWIRIDKFSFGALQILVWGHGLDFSVQEQLLYELVTFFFSTGPTQLPCTISPNACTSQIISKIAVICPIMFPVWGKCQLSYSRRFRHLNNSITCLQEEKAKCWKIKSHFALFGEKVRGREREDRVLGEREREREKGKKESERKGEFGGFLRFIASWPGWLTPGECQKHQYFEESPLSWAWIVQHYPCPILKTNKMWIAPADAKCIATCLEESSTIDCFFVF